MEKFVAYRRVSTIKQEKSGLGLADQDQMIEEYIQRVGGHKIGEFLETESGKRDDRPQLAKALELAKKHKAVLLVAKLDRLARNVAFVSKLMETKGVEFRAVDMPDANRMMIQMISVFAEYERKCISDRTTAAMRVRRERGLTCGNVENLRKTTAPVENKQKAMERAELMRPTIDWLKSKGFATVRDINDELNRRGHKTEKGMSWHPTTVQRLLQRLYGPILEQEAA